MSNELYHYGTPRHSGRYPWGSGDNPYQRDYGFMAQYRKLKADGLSEIEITNAMGYKSTTELRKKRSAEVQAEKAANIARANALKEKGYSNVKIAELMSTNGRHVTDTDVGNWLRIKDTVVTNKVAHTADILAKSLADKGGFIDIGAGSELDPVLGGVSKDRLAAAVKTLKDQGYEVLTLYPEQQSNPGHFTSLKVLAPPGTTVQDVWDNINEVRTMTEFSPNNGADYKIVKYPESLDSSRVYIRYAEDGGLDRDGTIELRRGVEDLSLGTSSYAQVRIAVDGTHYMKGMALYTDDIPEGYDVVYNSNKPKGTDKYDVYKKLKTDPETGEIDKDNPFGAVIKAGGQHEWDDANGHHLGVVNKLKDEGDWDSYKKRLSSQFLSKQPKELIKNQLDIAYADKMEEAELLRSLDNPVLKAKMLSDFAESCDKAAAQLHAAALPRQNSKVLLPVPELKDNEIYAPTYRNGEHVVLIRHPHGGTFEIPELVVNNKQPDAKKLLGNAPDAVGINRNVAQILSGADFDGDHVIVIPVNDNVRIKTSKLKALEGFDPSEAYPGYPGMEVIKEKTKQAEMGKVSNLITDMTLKGASQEELARAVKHSMVIIDAKKHELNWKLSEEENGIKALKKEYQGRENAGASTLISLANSDVRLPVERSYKPNPETGAWDYNPTKKTTTRYKRNSKNEIVFDEDGEPITITKDKLTKVKRMDVVKDANELSSGTVQEKIYANHANKLKALANECRKEVMAMDLGKADPTARKLYANEVESLNNKLKEAKSNAPRERNAQARATARVNEKLKANPEIRDDPDQMKKLRTQSLAKARAEVGAHKDLIEITDKEWDAIQAKAISPTKLREILDNTDNEKLKQRATPRSVNGELTPAQISKINALENAGYSISEISDAMGISTSTVSKYQ